MTILKNITYGIFNTMVLVPGTVDTFKNQFFPPAFSKVMSLQNKTNRSGGGWGRGWGWGINCLARSWQNLFTKKEKTKTQAERKGSPKKRRKKKDRQETRSTHNVFRL